jgi:predicted ATPase
VYCVWEDLHWIDPSSLEVLTLLLEQAPTIRLLMVLTFRPDFTPPWGSRSYVTQFTLSRLSHAQVREIVSHVAEQALRPSTKPVLSPSKDSGRTESESGGETSPVRAEPAEACPTLPEALIDVVAARTDGVPLFVEELTKSVVESGVTVGARHASPLQLAIPATLQDALMARLDRLGSTKELAQVGATLGREFSYDLLYAVSSLNEETLQQGLRQLVDAELIYQRGLPPQATYLFKHALVQDTAYQSLLKSRRQQLHQQIAQVLTERFPETVETQPELLAHHYTEAGLAEQAIGYWQKAGERAIHRSAYEEAVVHLTKGLGGLKALPNTAERAQQELTLQLALSNALMATKGYATPEVEQAYAQALALCRQMGEPPQLFPVLVGLWRVYITQARHTTALELGEQCLKLAQSIQNPVRLLGAHQAIGIAWFYLGELRQARAYLEQAMTLYNPQRRHFHASRSGQDPGVACLGHLVWTLWALGYPDKALKKSHQALTLAQELSHPLSSAQAFIAALRLHQYRREGKGALERSESLRVLSTENKFAFPLAWGTFMRGWALAEQGQGEEGISQMHKGLATLRATGAETSRPYCLACLAEAYGRIGQPEEGLNLLAEALAMVDNTQESEYEAELYRLKGELTLQQWKVESQKSKVPSSQTEAEECFLKAIDIAQKQQAKSLELRATVSLARLWRSQGKRHPARDTLSTIYNWFTEGFDMKDLQEAKAFLQELERKDNH